MENKKGKRMNHQKKRERRKKILSRKVPLATSHSGYEKNQFCTNKLSQSVNLWCIWLWPRVENTIWSEDIKADPIVKRSRLLIQ